MKLLNSTSVLAMIAFVAAKRATFGQELVGLIGGRSTTSTADEKKYEVSS